MRPCKLLTDEKRAEIAAQVEYFKNSGRRVEHLEYCVPSQETLDLDRRKDGTLKGSCNSHLFAR